MFIACKFPSRYMWSCVLLLNNVVCFQLYTKHFIQGKTELIYLKREECFQVYFVDLRYICNYTRIPLVSLIDKIELISLSV